MSIWLFILSRSTSSSKEDRRLERNIIVNNKQNEAAPAMATAQKGTKV